MRRDKAATNFLRRGLIKNNERQAQTGAKLGASNSLTTNGKGEINNGLQQR